MAKPERFKHVKQGKAYEPSVLWVCRTCGSFNLHPVEWDDFECICCGTIYQVHFKKEG